MIELERIYLQYTADQYYQNGEVWSVRFHDKKSYQTLPLKKSAQIEVALPYIQRTHKIFLKAAFII